jgi:recombination protein U
MIGSGKRFEQQWKDSIPQSIFYYRFRDGTSAWGEQENTRFQAKNMCDCEMFDGSKLYLLELKSHKGKSLPFSAFLKKNKAGKFDPSDKACLKQILDLSKASTYKNIIAGFVINFSDVGKTYFCKVDDVYYFVTHEDSKSIPIAWCEQWGKEISGKKKKVNWRWDISGFVQGYAVSS